MSFTTLTSVLRSVWRRPKRPLVQLPQNSVKLYERTPPAWARWALVLVTVDVMVATSAVDVIWNAWTMPDPNLPQISTPPEGKKPAAAPGATTTTENTSRPNDNPLSMLQIIPPGHVLVPAWKRALSGSLFVVSGIIVAASILAARSRVVRTVSYLRTTTPGTTTNNNNMPPTIYVQAASHPKKLGNAYEVRDCWLLPGNEHQMMLGIRDQGMWVLDMRGARIANRMAPDDRALARSTMFKTWKAVEASTRSSP